MHISDHFSDIVLLLAAAVVLVALLRLVKLSPVLGYLAAGAAIGPFGFAVIENVTAMAGVAEFGVMFLLFLIGLELSLSRLNEMRVHVFGFGGLQVLVTSGVFALAYLFYDHNPDAAIIIGGGLALSSTAVVMQLIQEQGEKSTQVGRLSLSALILQDLAVVPLLVLVPLLSEPDVSLMNSLGSAAVKAALCLVLIYVAGRLLLRPLFRFIASLDHTELFSATTLLLVLGVSYLTAVAGLSAALGAFLAGLLVAETEFKPQVEADILPFKGLLLGLFFMTVGMSLNLDLLRHEFIMVVALTLGLMLTKAAIIIALCRAFGFRLGSSLHCGLLLSQGGEFAFVLFALASTYGLLTGEVDQLLLAAVTLSMALTPFAAMLGKRLGARFERSALSDPEGQIEETLDLSQHVLISGFGRVGHTVARLLEAEDIRYVAIDMDSFLVAKERKSGLPVYYGDTTRIHVLSALGISRARAVIITHNDTRVSLNTIAAIRELNRDIPIIARSKNIEQVQKLERAGANLAVAEMFETSLQLGGALLRHVGVADYEIVRIIELFRAEDYALTRSAENEPH